jgi:uncharacterized protein YicC (UPF0701 family)
MEVRKDGRVEAEYVQTSVFHASILQRSRRSASAEVLSELDVASATVEDLHEMEERLTVRLGAAEERESLQEQFTTRLDRLSERIDDVESRVEEVRSQLTDRFEARIAKLKRRLFVAGIPAVAAIVAILNYLMG